MPEMIQNGENLVKVSKKQAGRLRKFFSKGLKTVVYIPGALFETLKELPKTVVKKAQAKVEEDMKKKNDIKKTDVTKETKETEITKVEEKPKETTQTKEKEQKETKKEKTVPATIKPKTLGELRVEQTVNGKEESTKDNEDIQENVAKQAVEPEKSEPKEIKEEKPKKERKDLKDLTTFKNYKDYKYAYFWNYYFNKYDASVLDKVSKDFAKGGDVNFYRDILTEAQFGVERAKQVKTKEIAELKKAHTEELEAAEEKRKADVQTAIDERQAEVDELNDKLTDTRSKNRVLNSKLRVSTDALEQIQGVIAPLGIDKIDKIISSCKEKCEGIDKRAEERAKAKEVNAESKSIDEQADDIMKEINKNVYGDESKKESTNNPVEPKVKEDEKEVFSNLANAVNQVTEQKATEENKEPIKQDDSLVLSGELDDMFPKQSNDESIIFHSNNPEYQGIGKFDDQNRLNIDWKTSPIENNSEPTIKPQESAIDYMNFDPETRTEVGLKAQEIVNNSNGETSFNEALTQAAQEFLNDSKSNGKTR